MRGKLKNAGWILKQPVFFIMIEQGEYSWRSLHDEFAILINTLARIIKRPVC